MHLFRMKRRSNASLAVFKGALLAATLFSAPAFAQSATADGAKQLQDSLSKTFGTAIFDKGIVTITPQGSAYAVKLDPAPAIAASANPDVSVSFDPIVYLATPNSDGTYAVTSDSSIKYSVTSKAGPDPFDMTASLEGCKSSGIFDPKISAFSSYDVSCAGQKASMHQPKADMDLVYGPTTLKMTGLAAAAGGTTLTMKQNVDGFNGTILIKDGEMPMPIKLTAKGATSDASIENAQLGTLFELISIAAQSKDPQKLIADQDAIKQKVLTALPIWNNLGGNVVVSDLSVETPFGTAKLATFEEAIAITGAVKDASYAIGLKYTGLQLPDTPLIPKWVGPLLPTQGNIDLKFSGVDLDAMARLAIQNFDATKKPPIPESLNPQFLQIFMSGQPQLNLGPSTFTASAGALSAQGSMSVIPTQKGKVTIAATNLDQIIAAVNSADVPNKDSAMMGIALIKGLAKTGADGKAIWDVDFDAATKAVSINGQVLSPGSAPGADTDGGDSGDTDGDNTDGGNAPQQ
jgi:hypothetical protein